MVRHQLILLSNIIVAYLVDFSPYLRHRFTPHWRHN
jgi:hypothetical protein